MRNVSTYSKRFAVLEGANRTQNEARASGFLYVRSGHGRVPGVEFTTDTPKTAADKDTTRTVRSKRARIPLVYFRATCSPGRCHDVGSGRKVELC